MNEYDQKDNYVYLELNLLIVNVLFFVTFHLSPKLMLITNPTICSQSQIKTRFLRPFVLIMDVDSVREQSVEVFRDIKPICVDLLDASNDSCTSESTLEHLLRSLSTTLYKPLTNDSDEEEHVISTKLADYIFMPISILLKRPTILEENTRFILQIITYLLNHSWKHNADEILLDQLGPLVVFLAGGDSINTRKESAADGKLAEFINSAARAIEAFLICTPRNYYTGLENSKRLSVLGDTTTLLLEFLQALDSSSEALAQSLLGTLTQVYSIRVSAQQASFVFPGMVSKVINFYLQTKNLHTPTVVAIIELLRVLTIKVFADDSLNLSESSNELVPSTADSVKLLLQDDSATTPLDLPVLFVVEQTTEHRTDAWLKATSKQYKLSLLAFSKALLLSPNSKSRAVSNSKLANSLIGFVSSILLKCFRSLYQEIVLVTVDIMSALHHAFTDGGALENEDLLEKISKMYIMQGRSNLLLLLEPLLNKTENLINSQLDSALRLMTEEKLALCLSATSVHIHLCESVLGSLMKKSTETKILKKEALQVISRCLKQSLVSQSSKVIKAEKENLLRAMSGDGSTEEASNYLDDVRLPPGIDARKIASTTPNRATENSLLYVSSLNRINFEVDSTDEQKNSLGQLLKLFSRSSEAQICKFLQSFGKGSNETMETFVDALLEPDQNEPLTSPSLLPDKAVPLWIANNLYKNSQSISEESFDVADFMVDIDFDDNSPVKQCSEADFFVLDAAKDVLYLCNEFTTIDQALTKRELIALCESLQAVALESIGLLSTKFSKEAFQTEVLIEYLYPLLESFAQAPESIVHLHAKLALKRISDAHYNGSLQQLIFENSDYLVDSLSIRFSVSGGLTPSLSGIILIVLKISGVQLLQSNQLQDIIAEMFIVIDSYHGYSVLVENFFVVFQEIIVKTKELYHDQLSDRTKITSEHKSAYYPWSMTSKDEMLRLLKDNEDLVDIPDDFDPQKEYFKRKPGVPFSDQLGDSDDEEDEAETDELPVENEKWSSFIAQNIYLLVEQIFKYGCQMLTHPSAKLRIQVLRTLKEAYPLLSTNYTTLMPLLADYFPLLLVLCTGSSTLSDHWRDQEDLQNLVNLIVPALELLEVVIEEDSKHEKFMASRYVEIWNFFRDRSPIIAGIFAENLNALIRENSSYQLSSNRVSDRIKHLYSKILLTGLRTYERTVPDLLAHEIVRVCSVLGIERDWDLGRDVQNHLWVLQNC